MDVRDPLPPPTEVRGQIGVLSLAMMLGMAPWFAATVVAPSLSRDLGLGSRAQAWLTLAVQLGFVIGSTLSAVLLLSDRYSARRLAAASAAIAAAATGLLSAPGIGANGAIGLRMITGAALAGVYPPGIKIAAGWSRTHRGTAIGILIGALTLGTAVPHLLRLVADLAQWRPVLYWAAGSAAVSALLFALAVREGPFQAPSAAFNPHALGQVLRDRSVMLATGGYLGHMWELFAMWSTLGAFLATMVSRHEQPPEIAPVLAFVIIGMSGAAGCVLGGIRADRIGKSRVAIFAMAISSVCALLVGPVTEFSLSAGVLVALVWGAAIVADSAQFSACVTVLAPPDYVGTALTLQTALGFLLTMLTIRLVPGWAELWGWQWAYAPLAAGPLLGIVAMRRLWISRHV